MTPVDITVPWGICYVLIVLLYHFLVITSSWVNMSFNVSVYKELCGLNRLLIGNLQYLTSKHSKKRKNTQALLRLYHVLMGTLICLCTRLYWKYTSRCRTNKITLTPHVNFVSHMRKNGNGKLSTHSSSLELKWSLTTQLSADIKEHYST